MSDAANNPTAAVPSTAQLRFRLVHLFYAMALIGSAVAVFGGWGLLVSGAILLFWGAVFESSSRTGTLLTGCLLVFFFLCPLSRIFQPLGHPPEVHWQNECMNNLRRISTAVLVYHSAHDAFPPTFAFPPAFIPDEQGRPKHSWRVLILPLLGEQALYDAYDFNEPWDGPNNRKLLAPMPSVYHCPAHRRLSPGGASCTSYVAIVGPRTLWPGAQSRKVREVKDGFSRTIGILEVDQPMIPWTKPQDVDFEEALGVLAGPTLPSVWPHCREDYFTQHSHGRHASFGDGSVAFLADDVDRATWSALLTIDDGSPRSDEDFREWFASKPKRKLGNRYRLAVFLAITLLPLPWVFLRRPKQEWNKP
jgi:hypothetical protein